MNYTAARRSGVAILAIAVLAVTGCAAEAAVPAPTSPPPTPTAVATPDLTRCRAAIRSDYEAGWETAGNDPWPPSTRQAVCSGIDRPVLSRLMDEAIADIMNGTPGPE